MGSSKHFHCWGLSLAVALAKVLHPVGECPLFKILWKRFYLGVTSFLLNKSLHFSWKMDHPWPGITLGIQSVPKATMSHCSIMRAAPWSQSLISGPSQVQIWNYIHSANWRHRWNSSICLWSPSRAYVRRKQPLQGERRGQQHSRNSLHRDHVTLKT